jgi:peptidoglycan hydrolase-like protein with peptidoglycan-binding domain
VNGQNAESNAPPNGQLIDYQRADVITPMIYPPEPRLVVSGEKPSPVMEVQLIPMIYIQQPEYWAIEVIGVYPSGPVPSQLPTSVPYTVELDLAGITGTVGVEVTGLNRVERIDVSTGEDTMPIPVPPTVQLGDTGETVRQAQRALRRTPNTALVVDGTFGPRTEAATKEFQKQVGLPVTGVVDEATWRALPSGAAMPELREGSSGAAVRSLQQVLTNGALGLWQTTPKAVDGMFGPNTAASVRAFQSWARIGVDGIVGQQTWDATTSLEFVVGLQHAVGVQPVAEA